MLIGAMAMAKHQKMTVMELSIVVVVAIFVRLLLDARLVQSHGFLSSPRSRNFVAFQDRVYYPITANDPLPEDCPNCLNRGGTLARCGIINAGNNADQWRNYDFPKNALGDAMKSNPQMNYVEGSIIDVEVILTAHHKGHFTFKACAISSTSEAPTQECFDRNPLTFVSDKLYGANVDTNYPERVYVAPDTTVTIVPSLHGFTNCMIFQYKLKLPEGLFGDLVLIQWYYVAANSACVHAGYDTYDWPAHWITNTTGNGTAASAWDEKVSVGTGLKLCDEVLPEDGDGLPEQFWNCAEVSITNANSNFQQQDTTTTWSTINNAEGTVAIEANIQPQDTASLSASSSSLMINGGIETSVTEATSQQPVTTTAAAAATTTSSSSLMSIQDTEASFTEATPSDASTTSSLTANGNKISKTIIGYYASWQWYDRENLAAPSNMDFTKVTRVNFAFFQTDTNGSIWGTDSWADPILLFGPFNWNPVENETEYCSWDSPTVRACNSHMYEEGLIHQVHAAGAEIYPSLGGWSLSDPFPEMVANEETRMNFVNNCVELIKEYGFDGIDIDWEYPGYEGTPSDTYNYNLLLRDLRSKLDELGKSTGNFYGLTAALPCGSSNIANIDIQTVAKYLTEFNLMTYDFFGAWSPTTGANAPLYDQNWGDDSVTGFSVDGCVRNWMMGGVSPSVINIGLPFYGRSFRVAKGLNETHDGNDKDTWYRDDGSPQYFNIVEKMPELTSVRHEPTKTQYAFKESGGLVSYDDEQAICDKAEYCLQHDLNGFIIWELSGDLMADLSTPLLDAVITKLTDPTLDCRTLVHDNPTTLSGNATAENQQSILSNQEPRPPSTTPIIAPRTIYPTTVQPTTPLYCPDDITSPRQIDGCTGWYHCVMGEPIYPIIRCPEGTLFDEAALLCLQSEVVSCSEIHRPTSMSITGPPDLLISSENPSTAPSWHPVAASAPAFQLSAVPTLDVPDAPTGFSEIPTLLDTTRPSQSPLKQSLSPSTQPIKAPSPPPAALHTEAPILIASVTHEPTNTVLECLDEYTGALPWNGCMGYYYCIDSMPQLPIISCEAGKLFDIASSACLDASIVDCAQISEPSTGTPNLVTTIPTKSPIDHRSKISTAQPSIESEFSTSSSNITPEFDDRPASMTPSETFEHSVADTSQEGNAPYDWSTTSDMSSIEYVPNSGLPQDFSFDGPFITVELLIKDYPDDVGWKLLWLDGAMIVEKPIGAYSNLEPNSVVFEFIPIQPSMSRSAAGHALEWTIMNVRGMGLNGGYWKMYSAAPNEKTLLATGVDFGYTDKVWLTVSNEGHISLRGDSVWSHQPPDSVPPAPTIVDEGPNNQGTTNVQNVGGELLHPNEVQNPQPRYQNRTLLTPVLASVAVVALFAGICFLFLAFRKNAHTCGEESEFFDKWNIEEPPEEDFFDDVPESEQDQCNHMYFDDHSDSIDPAGLFDGYEANADTDISPDKLSEENKNKFNHDLNLGPDEDQNDSLSHQSVDRFDEAVGMDASVRTQSPDLLYHVPDVDEYFG